MAKRFRCRRTVRLTVPARVDVGRNRGLKGLFHSSFGTKQQKGKKADRNLFSFPTLYVFWDSRGKRGKWGNGLQNRNELNPGHRAREGG